MLKKRIGAPIQEVNWEAWVVTLVAGDTQWNDKDDTDSTKLPYCSVGDWDNGNFWDWLNAVTSLGADEKSAVSLISFIKSYCKSPKKNGCTNFGIEPTDGLSLGVLILFGISSMENISKSLLIVLFSLTEYIGDF